MNPKYELSNNTPPPSKPMLPTTMLNLVKMSQKQVEQIKAYWANRKQ